MRKNIKNTLDGWWNRRKAKEPQEPIQDNTTDVVDKPHKTRHMKLRKNAETGEIISKEEAKTLDPSLWYEHTVFNKKEFLDEILEALKKESYGTPNGESVIDIDSVEDIFRKFD